MDVVSPGDAPDEPAEDEVPVDETETDDVNDVNDVDDVVGDAPESGADSEESAYEQATGTKKD